MTNLDIRIEPLHQVLAARLGLAAIDGAAERIDGGLSEVAALGVSDALAVLAVQSRNLAAALVAALGIDGARAVFARTVLDAGVAGDE